MNEINQETVSPSAESVPSDTLDTLLTSPLDADTSASVVTEIVPWVQKPLNDYTTTEGLLLLIFIVFVFDAVLKLFGVRR